MWLRLKPRAKGKDKEADELRETLEKARAAELEAEAAEKEVATLKAEEEAAC